MKMKAKMVFDSPSRCAAEINKSGGAGILKCMCFFSEDSHAKQIISPAIVPYTVTYSTEGTLECLLLSVTQTATMASCSPLLWGKEHAPYSVINHIFLYSLIKVSEYIQLKNNRTPRERHIMLIFITTSLRSTTLNDK